MAVKGDASYVGDQAGAEAYVGAGTEITDLGGKTVLPVSSRDICMSAIWGKTT